LGQDLIEIKEVPGHTPGHVLFHLPALKAAFCGDLIFHHSIGRTDLPGGDYRQLLQSIRTQVFTLPPETTLFPGMVPQPPSPRKWRIIRFWLNSLTDHQAWR